MRAMLAPMASETPSSQPPKDACLRCGSPLASLGIEQFRVGGTTGGWKLLFGEWAELGEGMLSMEVLACTSCGRVELRRPGSSGFVGPPQSDWEAVWQSHDRQGRDQQGGQ